MKPTLNIKGKWSTTIFIVDKQGAIIDFDLSEAVNEQGDQAFFDKA